jgi:hypothetical protein
MEARFSDLEKTMAVLQVAVSLSPKQAKDTLHEENQPQPISLNP